MLMIKLLAKYHFSGPKLVLFKMFKCTQNSQNLVVSKYFIPQLLTLLKDSMLTLEKGQQYIDTFTY